MASMGWLNRVGGRPNRPPSRHFGRLPSITLVPCLLAELASDWQWIGVFCANAYQSCVNPVSMNGSDRCDEGVFG